MLGNKEKLQEYMQKQINARRCTKTNEFEFPVVIFFNSIFASHKKVNNLDSDYVHNYERIVDKLEKYKKYK